MDLTSINLAYNSLKRQRRRTFLTMLAIAIGIGAIITIMAAGEGMKRLVLGQLDAFGPDSLSIEPRVPSSKKSSTGIGSIGITITSLKDRDLTATLKYPNIVAAYGMVSGQEAVSYQGQIKKVMLMGHGYAMPMVENFSLTAGRFYTRDEEESLAPVVVLGSGAKEKLFGDEDAIDKIIYIRGKTFKVIGVMAKRGSAFFFDLDNQIVIPTKTMQKKLLGIDYLQMIIARMKDGSQSKNTAADLTDIIRQNHNINRSEHDDFIVNTTADAAAILTTITSGITMLLVALVCISLIVGGVGIMNIMYVSVAERTFEIGLRKSVGANSHNILWQFLMEALLITVGGGIIGIIIGVFIALGIYALARHFDFKWIFSIPISSIILSIGFSGAIGIIFGIYPAKKAASLNPIDALRHE